MNDLRREIIDGQSEPDPHFPPRAAFIIKRSAALAGLYVNHAQVYRHLRADIELDGQTEEHQATALDCAGNLGMLLQELRSEEMLVEVAASATEEYVKPALMAVDQLMFSFLILSAPASESQWNNVLAVETVDEFLRAPVIRRWLTSCGVTEAGAD